MDKDDPPGKESTTEVTQGSESELCLPNARAGTTADTAVMITIDRKTSQNLPVKIILRMRFPPMKKLWFFSTIYGITPAKYWIIETQSKKRISQDAGYYRVEICNQAGAFLYASLYVPDDPVNRLYCNIVADRVSFGRVGNYAVTCEIGGVHSHGQISKGE
jgi:hypothetical protein